ncbi:MAG: N-6 DNA methylase [Gammaproteobacteria bacterium]
MARRRLNGAYYTTEEIADIVAGWALAGRAAHVLDPSFGGCSFLRVALRRLRASGMRTPGHVVFGVDRDPDTACYAAELVASGVPRSNLRIADFFSVRADGFPQKFGAVVGNPPYVRHHLLSPEAVECGQQAAAAVGVSLSRRADLWAYFVAHSLSFIQAGGRLAFLLPGALLHADYAAPILEKLERISSEFRLVQVRERLFSDTSERTVLLLATGVWNGSCAAVLHEVQDAAALAALLDSLQRAPNPLPSSAEGRRGALTGPDVDSRVRALYSEVSASSEVRVLGDVATIRLGVVTGANRFFVRRSHEIESLLQPGVAGVPVVSRASWLAYPSWRAADHAQVSTAGRACKLLSIRADARLRDPLLQEVLTAEALGYDERSHCRKRQVWYALTDLDVSGVLLPYMGAQPPRLVMNFARATSTNAVHRLDWRRPGEAKRAVAGSWTSIFGLGVEQLGRSYGGGVLKLELGDATRVPVPLAASVDDFEEVDRVARNAGRHKATEVADQLILQERLGLAPKDVRLLRGAVVDLGLRRHPLAKG